MIDFIMSDDLIHIVILDNHALVRAGIRLLVDNHEGMVVVGDSGNLTED
jgi:DNA-binding NarL/FixJ family response regulator